MSGGEPILEIRGLSATYPGGIRALDDVALECRAGRVALILGPNGAGKSTLVRCLTGFMPAEGVRVEAEADRYKGRPFLSLPPERRVDEGIVFVPEQRKVFETLTVRENLAAVTRLARADADAVALVDDLFPQLKGRMETKAGLLSGGEKQMLAIARALVLKPDVLVLDEPSQGLAPRLIAQVLGSVQEIQRSRGIGVILVEQAVRAALPLADWVYVMNRGRVTRSMPPDELRALGEFDAVYLQDEVGERSGG